MRQYAVRLATIAALAFPAFAGAETARVFNVGYDILIPNGSAPDKFAGTDFPQTKVGFSSFCSLYVTTSGGGGSITIGSINISGQDADEFTIDPPDDLVIGLEESQLWGISFWPEAFGTRTATVTINYTGPDPQSYTFQVRGSGYTNFPLASANLSSGGSSSSHKINQKTQNVTFKSKVYVINQGKIPLETGIMRVFRTDKEYFDDTAVEVLTIPLKKMRGSEAGKPDHLRKYKIKLDMGNDFNESIFIRIYPLTPTDVDDYWPANQEHTGYTIL